MDNTNNIDEEKFVTEKFVTNIINGNNIDAYDNLEEILQKKCKMKIKKTLENNK